MSAADAMKKDLAKQVDSEVVIKTASESFKWAGSVRWPHPDDWEMEHWDFHRTATFEQLKKRTGKPPYDTIKEEFLIGLRFTLEYGSADFKGVDFQEILDGTAKIKPRFMIWFYNQWVPYTREILDPKG